MPLRFRGVEEEVVEGEVVEEGRWEDCVRDIFYVIGKSFDKMHSTCN